MSQKRSVPDPLMLTTNSRLEADEPRSRHYPGDLPHHPADTNFPEKQKSKYQKHIPLQDSYQEESFFEGAKDHAIWKSPQNFEDTGILGGPARGIFGAGSLDSQEASTKVVPVRLRSPDRPEVLVRLNIRFFSPAKLGKPTLMFRLTSDENVQFIKILEMSEAEFLVLRAEQNMRIDFFSFPQSFFRYLQLVCSSAEENPAVYFSCVAEIHPSGATTVRILEQNEFKVLEHLVLKFSQPDDTVVKNYLADCLLASRKREEEAAAKIERLEEGAEAARQDIRALAERVKDAESDLQAERERSEAKLQDKLREVESAFMERFEKKAEETDRMKRSFEAEAAQRDEENRAKIEQLTKRFHEALDGSKEANGRGREIHAQLISLQTEHEATLRVLQAERERVKERDDRLAALEKELNGLRFNFSVLETTVKDKEETKAQQQETNRVLSQTIAKQDAVIEELHRQKDKLEKKLFKSAEEINRANDILSHVEAKKQKQKNRIMELKMMMVEANRQVEEQGLKFNALKNREEALAKELTEKDRRVQELEAAEAASKSKLEQLLRQTELDKVTITHLNEQLGESRQPFLASMNNAMGYTGTLGKTYHTSATNHFTQKYSSIGQTLMAESKKPLANEPSDFKGSDYDFLLRAPQPTTAFSAKKETDYATDWGKKIPSTTLPKHQSYSRDEADDSLNSLLAGTKFSGNPKTSQPAGPTRFGVGDTGAPKEPELDLSFDQPQRPALVPTPIINPIRFRPPNQQN